MKKTQLILTISLQQVTFSYLRGFHHSYALFCSYEEEGYPFKCGLVLKNWDFCVFYWLYFTQCLASFSTINQSSSLCHFWCCFLSKKKVTLMEINEANQIFKCWVYSKHHKAANSENIVTQGCTKWLQTIYHNLKVIRSIQ